jgi:hypothetical protein
MQDHEYASPTGSDAILGTFSRDERLARAAVMGVPSFMRRARAVEEAVERTHALIRAEWARRVKLFSAGGKRSASRVRAFNRRWARFLESVPIEDVRKAQSDYNRYYPIERELALPHAPRLPFAEIPLVERAHLVALFPPLPE